MIGGHYIAYCLVDPEKMFGDAPMPTDLEVEKKTENIEECRPEPVGEKKDRRVWCFCSEYVHLAQGLVTRLMSSTSIRLATVDEVLSARAYMCFVSLSLGPCGELMSSMNVWEIRLYKVRNADESDVKDWRNRNANYQS